MTPLFFIDDTAIGSPQANYLPILGGFVVTSRGYDKLRSKLARIKKAHGLTEGAPIKWSPGQQDPRYAELRKVPKLNEFRADVLKLLSAAPIRIIISVIDVDLLSQTYDRAYYLQQSVDHLAKRFHYMFDGKADQYEKGLMCLDYPGPQIESKLAQFYKTIHVHGASSGIKITSLADTLFYSHGFACDGLQLADFVVGCMGWTLKKQRYFYFDLIKNRIRAVKGKRKGCGIVVFPSNSARADRLCRV